MVGILHEHVVALNLSHAPASHIRPQFRLDALECSDRISKALNRVGALAVEGGNTEGSLESPPSVSSIRPHK